MTHHKHFVAIGMLAATMACNRSNQGAASEEAQRGTEGTPNVPAQTQNAGGASANATPGGNGGGGGAMSGLYPSAERAEEQKDTNVRRAKGEFSTVAKMQLTGLATLEEKPSGVKIVIAVEKAPPGNKAVHIHQKGDCSNIAGKSMGDHFAPNHEHHGMPWDKQHHPGDLGNLMVGDDGKGRLELTTDAGNLKPEDPMSFVGRAIVIHESNDKGTQPSGDSGKPMACAVIRAAGNSS